MKRYIKLAICSVFYYAGLFWLVRLAHKLSGRHLTVLTLHRVTAGDETVGLPTISISSKNFQRLISFVRRHYNVISVADYIRSRREQTALPRHSLILSFDDAYLEFAENARPVLAEDGMAAVVFVPTAAVDSRSIFWWDRLFALLAFSHAETLKADDCEDRLLRPFWREAAAIVSLAPSARRQRIFTFIDRLQTANTELRDRVVGRLLDALATGGMDEKTLPGAMSWEDVRECSRSGVEIGSHTVNHEFLTSVSKQEARYEVSESKALLENRLNDHVCSFSYPGGRYDESVRQLVQSAEYECAFTSIEGLNSARTNRFELRRINVSDDNLIGPWGKFSRAITAWNLFMRW